MLNVSSTRRNPGPANSRSRSGITSSNEYVRRPAEKAKTRLVTDSKPWNIEGKALPEMTAPYPWYLPQVENAFCCTYPAAVILATRRSSSPFATSISSSVTLNEMEPCRLAVEMKIWWSGSKSSGTFQLPGNWNRYAGRSTVSGLAVSAAGSALAASSISLLAERIAELAKITHEVSNVGQIIAKTAAEYVMFTRASRSFL